MGEERNVAGSDGAMHEVFVPGRLCILGEHTDWAAGYRDKNASLPQGMTLVATTREGLHARVECRNDGRLVFMSSASSRRDPTGEETVRARECLNVAMTDKALQKVVHEKGFFMYVAGTALVVCSRFGLLLPPPSTKDGGVHSLENESATAADAGNASPRAPSGLTVDNHLTTLPLKKGLSSSAAVCVLVVRALSMVYGLNLSVPQIMELAHLGEARAGSKCGRMDQCCALGTNHVAAMFFDGEDVKIYEVPPPACGIFLVVADLNGSKDTIKMLASLNKCFPHAKDEQEERVHRYMRDNASRAWRAVQAVEGGDARELGRAMTAAQECFDACAMPICPSEFCSPLLRAIMANERVRQLTWAVKGVGAQGDGSVQLLARGREEQDELTRVLMELGMSCVMAVTVMRPTEDEAKRFTFISGPDANGAPPVRAVDEANGHPPASTVSTGNSARDGQIAPPGPTLRMIHPRRVRSAVIVAAGLSTRMFPASAVVKKELFPVVDHDGVCKPVILAIMEGLVEAGIERFVIVVQQKDIQVFDDFFSMRAVEKHKHRLKPPQRAYCSRIEAMRSRITYAVQERQEGFGHAVYCARNALGAQRAAESNGAGPLDRGGQVECGADSDCCDEAFLLVLGDHLYRRGPGTTQACASQLIHAYLEHGEAGKPAIGLKVMGENSVSPYGVAAGNCVAHPPAHIVDRWHRATKSVALALGDAPESVAPAESVATASNAEAEERRLEANGDGQVHRPGGDDHAVLGGRVYRLTKLVEKPTIEFAREHLVTPGLGRGRDGEGRHLVVFGQYVLPTKRTFDILAEDIMADRRERGEFQLTSVLDRMRREDDGMLGCTIHGDALDMGIPGPYVATMQAFSRPYSR